MEAIEFTKPNVKVYDTFSEFIENIKNQISTELDETKNQLKMSWFRPGKEVDSSSLDVDKIPKMFDRDELQDDYQRYLTEPGAPIEAFSIKFQNGYIAASEQAYRIQHASLPRALAQGCMDNLRWANETIPYLLINRIKVISDLVDKDYANRSSD